MRVVEVVCTRVGSRLSAIAVFIRIPRLWSTDFAEM